MFASARPCSTTLPDVSADTQQKNTCKNERKSGQEEEHADQRQPANEQPDHRKHGRSTEKKLKGRCASTKTTKKTRSSEADVSYLNGGSVLPERYWRSTHPTELTMIEARDRDEQKFKHDLQSVEKEMNELRRFYLERNGFSDSPIPNHGKEANKHEENPETPPFDFAEAKEKILEGNIDALLQAGYAIAKDSLGAEKRLDTLPEYIDLFSGRVSDEE
ncbi:hypothetical protein R1sor_021000 [Riccia sorocarpa]|uniref:Uncharacterized protein n=1 Tax=Riccia sorocarpa TaxID=122646 RepID=A0ABD3GHW9_9MARC